MFRNSLLVITLALINDQKVAIVDRIKINKDIAQILHLKSVFERQVCKMKYYIELYIFVVVSKY